MEDLKDRYGFILGFVGLAISLSAFKDELSRIIINLGFIKFPLSWYFFAIIIGFVICLYLYTIERVVRNTRFGNYGIFDYIIKIAFTIFILLLSSPIFLILSILCYQIIHTVGRLNKNTVSSITSIFSVIIGVMIGYFSSWAARKTIIQKKDKQQEELEYQEIRELEKATRLLNDGYYSQTILETFKVLEIHLFKLLKKMDVRIQRHRFPDILTMAQKKELISSDDVNIINDIRLMRNSAAHLNAEHTKEQADKAVNFVKKLIQRQLNPNELHDDLTNN